MIITNRRVYERFWLKARRIVPIPELLETSDAITIHLARNAETRGFLSAERISKLKKGVILVTTVGQMIDEAALADALRTGQVDSCALEVSDVKTHPLAEFENAVLFKGFGWYTKEALERSGEIWINNIEGILRNQPVNPLW